MLSKGMLTPLEAALIDAIREAETKPEYALGVLWWIAHMTARAAMDYCLDVRIDENALECPIDRT